MSNSLCAGQEVISITEERHEDNHIPTLPPSKAGRFAFTLIALLIATQSVYARESSDHKHSTHSTSTSSRSHSSHASTRAASGVTRDSHGHIKRSQQAKNGFKHKQPCPSTGRSSGACSGYVIDHVVALKRGGADASSNMQWQAKEAAKQKDKWE